MEKEAKKPKKSPLTAGERAEQGTATEGKRQAVRLSKKTVLTRETVEAIIKKPKITLRELGRMMMYNLADAVNRDPHPAIDGVTLGRLFGNTSKEGKWEEWLAFQTQQHFYETAIDALNNEQTCLQREAFMDARRALLTPLCLQAMGGEAAELDCDRQAQARVLDAAREGYAFLSTGDRDKIRDILTDADFADRKDNRQRFTPFQLVQIYIAGFYALAAVLDIAAEVYAAPELRTIYHPFAILPKCEATVNLYNALREEFYKRNPEADPERYPAMDLQALKPDAAKVAALRNELKRDGKMHNIAIPLNKIQSVRIWNYTNPYN